MTRKSLKKRTSSKTLVTAKRSEKWYGSNWIRREKRRAIYNRDGRACVYCGRTHDLSLDHVVPTEHGGTNEATNLVTACRRCNARKGSMDLRSFARMLASETGTTTRTITNKVRKHLKLAIDVRAAKAELENERDEREERAAIKSADTGAHTFVDEAYDFDFDIAA
jgi:5-methylcytosine-specific restriction endonuclease McrA